MKYGGSVVKLFHLFMYVNVGCRIYTGVKDVRGIFYTGMLSSDICYLYAFPYV